MENTINYEELLSKLDAYEVSVGFVNTINYIGFVKVCMECDESYWVETGCDCGADNEENEEDDQDGD